LSDGDEPSSSPPPTAPRPAPPSWPRWVGAASILLSVVVLILRFQDPSPSHVDHGAHPFGAQPGQPLIPDRALLGERAPANADDDVVSRGKGLVSAIALSGPDLFVAEMLTGDRISRVALSSGQQTDIGSARLAISIAVRGDRVLVADQGDLMNSGKGSIVAIPAAGGAPVVLASSLLAPIDVAADATFVYWADGGTPEASYSDGSLKKVPHGGGAAVTITREREPTSVAVDGTWVVWSRNGGPDGAGAVMRASLEGGDPELVARSGRQVKDVVLVGADVYWLSADDMGGGGGTIFKAPIAGGAVTQVARAANRMCRMTVDDEAVYWTDPGEVGDGASTAGRIMKQLHRGGDPVILAEKQDRPCYVAVDATHVVFSTQSFERVKRAPKNPGR
jgi:hypothetical protein